MAIHLSSVGNMTYGNYKYAPAFSPSKGVIIIDDKGVGIVATCSAVVYYMLVKDSIETLNAMSPLEIASAVETSLGYAEIIRERLIGKLQAQYGLMPESEEFVLGLVRTNGEFYAVGHRLSSRKTPSKKVSKETALRRRLPIGSLAVYPITDTARIYETTGKKKYKSVSVGAIRLSDIVGNDSRHVIIICDSAYFRKYCGRTIITRDSRWEEWDEKLYDSNIVFVREKSALLWTAKGLREAKNTDVYTTEINGGAPDLKNTINVLEYLVAQNPNGMNLTVYTTGGTVGLNAFTKYIRELLLSGYNISISLMRAGIDGGAALGAIAWGIKEGITDNLAHSVIRTTDDSVRLADMMGNVVDAFTPIQVGVEFNGSRIKRYKLLDPATVAESIAYFKKDQLLVNPKYVPEPKPPYLFGRGNTLMITGRSEMPEQAFAVIPRDPKLVLPAGTIIGVTDADLGMLLAKE